MSDPKVLLSGQDIYAKGYVKEIPKIQEKKTFKKDKLVTNEFSLNVINTDDFFSVGNSKSLYGGNNYIYEPFTITGRQGEIIWNGQVIDISRNHEKKLATIKSRNSLFKFRNEYIEYESSDWETGANAFKNISDAIGFKDYDNTAVTNSINRLTAAGALLEANFNKSNKLTFQKAIEKLAEYSNADAYSHDGRVYFVHWIPFAEGISINLTIDDLKTKPVVSNLEKEIINDYLIGYDSDGGIGAIDSDNNNIGEISRKTQLFGTKQLPELRSGDGNMIVYKNLATAVYIGEGYIKRTQRAVATNPTSLQKITLSLYADHKDWITLQSFFTLTLADESWTQKIFETFDFTINENKDDIKITAIEVVTA